MNAIANTPVVREVASKRHPAGRPAVILVATDGSEGSHAAYTAAELIAAQARARVHMLSVVETFPGVAQLPGSTNSIAGRRRGDKGRTIVQASLARSRFSGLEKASRWFM